MSAFAGQLTHKWANDLRSVHRWIAEDEEDVTVKPDEQANALSRPGHLELRNKYFVARENGSDAPRLMLESSSLTLARGSYDGDGSPVCSGPLEELSSPSTIAGGDRTCEGMEGMT